jgi:hypothetical protein
MSKIIKISIYLSTVSLLLVFSCLALAGEYEGTWKLIDTQGKSFEVTLAQDGTATSTHSAAMKGSWKEENGSAVIHWDTGWTTRISKEGDKYIKSTYKPNASLSGIPSDSSEALKR